MGPLFKTYLGFGVISGILLFFNYSRFEFIQPYVHEWTDILIVIMAAQNVVMARLIYRKSLHDPNLYPVFVIVSFIFRLLVAVVIMVLIWLLEVKGIETFAINLVVIYLVFLTFELYSLLTILRPNSEQGPSK